MGELDDDSVAEETPRPAARGGAKRKAATSAGTSKARASSQRSGQSSMTSFTSTRKPATTGRKRVMASRNQYMDSDSDDEPSSKFGGSGAWGSASQNTKG